MKPCTEPHRIGRPDRKGAVSGRRGCPVPSRRLVLPLLLATGLGLGSSGAVAWGAKANYPTSASPTMPGAEQAQRVALAPPALFRVLSDAHQSSRDRGWKGIGPAFGEFEALTPE